MSDNSDSGQGVVNGGQQPDKSGGQLLPFFTADDRPSILSVSDCNAFITVLRKVQRLQVHRVTAQADQTGAILNSANVLWSGENLVIELQDAPIPGSGQQPSGGGNVTLSPMQVQSYSTANDYLVAKDGSFTSPGTFTATGSNINVALPWELRASESPGSGYVVSQPYTAGDIIYVVDTDAGDNGVYVSGSELTVMDLGLGKTWLAPSGRPFTIQSVSGTLSIYGNYFIALDVLNGNAPTRIAKPYKLRNSITSQTIDGNAWSYSYTSTVQRTASFSGYSEYQRISERYLAGDVIMADLVGNASVQSMVSVADTISGTPGAPIVWIDRNTDGREWTVRADQTAP